MGAFQPFHLALVALVVLLVFGPRKLPELARGMGDAIKELQKALHGKGEPEPSGPVVANTSLAETGAAPAEGVGSTGRPSA